MITPTPGDLPEPAAAQLELEAMWKLVGSQITAFGMNYDGEIVLTTNRGHEFVIGKDEHGQIALYEIERRPA